MVNCDTKKFIFKAFIIATMVFPIFIQSKQTNLVDVTKVIPTIVTDIRYATKNNFTKEQIYPCAKCYLLPGVADALKKVQEELALIGLGLKIWDAYRPHAAQFKLWDVVSDPRYVGDPKKGSRHNYGAAVDLTIVDLKTGRELEMPTEFDNFTERAWRNYRGDDVSGRAIKNRELLQRVMEKHGFVGLETEWWHFDYKEWQKYKILDISFQDLE